MTGPEYIGLRNDGLTPRQINWLDYHRWRYRTGLLTEGEGVTPLPRPRLIPRLRRLSYGPQRIDGDQYQQDNDGA